MTPLMTLLAAHYLCEAAAETGALDASAMRLCMENYTQVKQHFAAPAPDMSADSPGARNLAAYAAFKAWEAANPALVAELRRKAFRDLPD